ncbi:MAG: hypothetical protein O7I42_20385 [Alphaproteobacteria bacterium]|nr:hypothetical protein [Alphaproteobacteria bacterium]
MLRKLTVLLGITLVGAAVTACSPARMAADLAGKAMASGGDVYLTPPVGMNLYLAAFRFEKPLGEVIVSVLPILGVMLIFVLAITYLPLVLPFPGF